MQQLIADILANPDRSSPLHLPNLALPAPLKVLALAPHPDDFDAIGVTMRLLHSQGHEIHVAVVTTGASGIKDGWNGLCSNADKADMREAEQRASCRFFGLPAERLTFLRLWEDADEHPTDDAAERTRMRSYLSALRPDLVFLPHGNDSNATHRRNYDTFRSIAVQDNLKLWACLNQDAKTISMRADLYTCFGNEDAAWKADLLRLHRSQHERNLKTRGIGFDQRVLDVNRASAADVRAAQTYAEVFELQRFGG